MFRGCSSLTQFTSKLPSLTEGMEMFNGCESLTSFSIDLSSLTNGGGMFLGCYNLTTFTSDLSSLEDGASMFEGCSLNTDSIHNIALTINKNNTNRPTLHLSVDHWITDEQAQRDYDLINYKGWDLTVYNKKDGETYTSFGTPKYAGCTTVAEITAKNANYKTSDIVNGVWTEHLPDLNWACNDEGVGLFEYCFALTSFNADLSSLTDCGGMFYHCTELSSFNSNLSSLTNGQTMFADCSKLTSFNADLSSL
jgi:hypothetical protein